MRRSLIVIVAVLALSACWEQSGFDAGNSSTSGLGSSVNTGNVGSLTHVFTDTQPTLSTFHAVVSGGKLFAVGDRLSAFDAGGCSGTIPASCAPIWQSASSGGFGHDVVVGGGKVWVTYEPGATGVIRGYDPGGASCPTPTTCAPAITITTPHGQPTTLRWIGDTLQVTDWVGAFGNDPAHHYHYAYNADGTLRWQADLGTATSFYTPEVPLGEGNTVVVGLPLSPPRAFDNRGIPNCSGTPKTCTPMWSYAAQNALAARAGRIYGTTPDPDAKLAAFDAAGVQGCGGAPKVCGPLWSAAGAAGYQAVDDTHLFARVADGSVGAFALDGTGCSGSPLVCQPQWTSVPGASGVASVTGSSEAGGVLYTISHICDQTGCPTPGSWYVDAHDAAGTVGCSGAPKVCHSLFSKALPFKPDEVMIVGDVVYVTGDASNNASVPYPPVWGFRIPSAT
jgi:hypothetical protein